MVLTILATVLPSEQTSGALSYRKAKERVSCKAVANAPDILARMWAGRAGGLSDATRADELNGAGISLWGASELFPHVVGVLAAHGIYHREDGVMTDDKLLTPAEVADKLGIGPLTVVRWLRAGKLPGRKFGRKFWRVRPDDLEAFINEVPTLAQMARALERLPSLPPLMDREGED